MRSESNPSNTSRKRARLFRITRHERPAWKPSSTSLANNSRSPCSGTPHSSSWYASINGSASSPAQQRRFMAPEFCMDDGPPASIRAMRFLQVTERDGRYVASLAETERPVPREGEVLVRVAASGVNRADLLQIAGRYPPPPGEPEIIGLELSGTTDATGAAVCALVAGGGHAEYVAAPAGQLFPAPAGPDLVTAAGIPEAFLTAFVNLVIEAHLARGERLLVHAGASGVGLAAIQLGKLVGARVAATTRTSAKLAALESAGAELAIDTARAQPRREGRDRGAFPAGDPSGVRVGRAAGSGGLGVSRGPGGRGVPTHARQSQRRQDPDRMAARLVAAAALALAAACRGEHRSAAAGVGHVAAPDAAARSDAVNLYAAAGANRLSPRAAQARPLVYVPNSKDGTVTVIDARSYVVLRTFPTGALPQHVVPAYDLGTLWVANNLAGTLTPIDPATGQEGTNVPVDDPYNLYFTPDGGFAIVVAERRRRLDFRDAHTMTLVQSLPVQCKGVDHMEFTADGRFAVATCEFSGQLVKVDLGMRSVVGYLTLDPDGLDSVTVLDPRERRIVATWPVPGGGSPDMGNVTADGKELWVSGRYDEEVYVFDTETGQLTHRIKVGREPHGLCVWPQPGRYS